MKLVKLHSMQHVKPPRAKLKTLYAVKDDYDNYDMFFATDTKRFYMKIDDELMAITSPLETENKQYEYACRNCNNMIPNNAWSKNSSVVKCPRCGFVFDSNLLYEKFTKRPESTICIYDIADYISSEIDKIITTTDETSLISFFNQGKGYNIRKKYKNDTCDNTKSYIEVYTTVKNPIVFTYPFLDSKIEASYKGKRITILDDAEECKLIVIIEPPSKRIRKPENKKLKIDTIYFDNKFEESDTPEGLFKDSIESFSRFIKEQKEKIWNN